MINEYSLLMPFEKPFFGTISPGFKLTINGHVPSDCRLFTINLTCGQSRPGFPEPNNALHLSCRFYQRKIVINTFVPTSEWGLEHIPEKFPLEENKPFQFNICAEDFSFKIFVNKAFFTEYKYRLPLNTIKVLSITGNVNIYQVNSNSPGEIGTPSESPNFESGGAQGPPPAYTPLLTAGLPLFLNSVTTPTTIRIPGNMRPGMAFSISGTPSHGNKFDCNWIITNNDYALHISTRMESKAVVRNHKVSSSWGTEEREPNNFPFSPGVVFHLLVRCETTHFEILVNGQPFTNFKYRVHPITDVHSFNIRGDVTIHFIHITA